MKNATHVRLADLRILFKLETHGYIIVFPSNQLKIVSLFEFVFLFQLYDSSIIDTEWKNVASGYFAEENGKDQIQEKDG